MSFRVLARTLLHLGSELISSDVVALYELVKNSFDAGSKRVTIDVVVRMKFADVERYRTTIDEIRSGTLPTPMPFSDFRTELSAAVDSAAPEAADLRREFGRAPDWDAIADTLAEANFILVTDTGEGMSLQTLSEAFLTIGTRSRHDAIEASRLDARRRPVLGEKGIGRLSTMRLGGRLLVESTMAGESHWNVLEIDWSKLSHESEALIESFVVDPYRGKKKEDVRVSGTRVRVSSLNSEWSHQKLRQLGAEEFSKLTDPFESRTVFPVTLRFNGEPQPVPHYSDLLLKNAHATVHAQLAIGPNNAARLTGTVRYKEREQVFALEGAHLTSAATCSPDVLESLGPFSLDVYWYNRRLLTAVEGIGNRTEVGNLVREWGGGVMVYRDGFRVLPYGSRDDDWLDLDRTALASGGYKVNRAQLIGRLGISRRTNPALTDQSNREGLRDSPEKQALLHLLRYVLLQEMKAFLDKTDKEIRAREPAAIEEIEERVVQEEQRVLDNLAELERRVPAIREHREVLSEMRAALAQLKSLAEDVRDLAASYEEGRGQLLNLAAIGLSVEMLAHELNRATEYALLTLSDAPKAQLPQPMGALVRTLEAQLKTLQRRLRYLDPLSTAARQTKETFDVVGLVRDIVEIHSDRFAREGIECQVRVYPAGGAQQLRIKAVRGMIIQIVENLMANSVYWLRQQHILDPSHQPKLELTIDTATKEIRVRDNGPGVPPEIRDRIFEAFFSTKPAGEGKGLGLFIAREIARYHDAELFLADEPAGSAVAPRTFVLTLGGMA